MTPIIAGILMAAGDPGTRFWLILISLAAGTIMLVAICWGAVEKWIKRTRGRNWPTISAVIDIISVAFIPDDSIPSPSVPTDNSGYLATLTYVYRNPELQMGDYSRRFAKEDAIRPARRRPLGGAVIARIDRWADVIGVPAQCQPLRITDVLVRCWSLVPD